MGVYKEEYVVVRKGLEPWDPVEITVNCPDKVGLAFDLNRIVFEFGLCVTKGDMSTDNRWCFVVLWVTPLACPSAVDWQLLKLRLEAVCPSALAPCWLPLEATPVPEAERVMLLGIFSSDRIGFLHDVVRKLWTMELNIHKAHACSRPGGKAIGLFFCYRQQMQVGNGEGEGRGSEKNSGGIFGDGNSVCDIRSAGRKHGGLDCHPLPTTSMTEEIFWDDPATFEQDHTRYENRNLSRRVVVTVDNNASPAHSVLQVSCKIRKGLLYDCLRIVKDFNLKVAHARIPSAQQEKDSWELSLFVVDSQGRQVTDLQEQQVLVRCLKEELWNPVRIKVETRGMDTQLVVATPIEKGGKGRPRVLHDITQALNILDISIFKVDFGRHVYNEKNWEIYQFLLVEKEEPSLTCSWVRNRVVDRVRQEMVG